MKMLACGKCSQRGLRKTLLIPTAEHGFAVIANPQPVVGIIDAVISFVSDEHNARAAVDVAVIGDVEQQFVADLALNPAMKDWDQRIKVDALRILQQKLHVNVLQLDGM